MNWMRRTVQSMLRASALLSMVLPTPGTSSMSRWPSASITATAEDTTSGLPSMTRSMLSRTRRVTRCTVSRSAPPADVRAARGRVRGPALDVVRRPLLRRRLCHASSLSLPARNQCARARGRLRTNRKPSGQLTRPGSVEMSRGRSRIDIGFAVGAGERSGATLGRMWLTVGESGVEWSAVEDEALEVEWHRSGGARVRRHLHPEAGRQGASLPSRRSSGTSWRRD